MHGDKFEPLLVFILRLGRRKVSWLNDSTLTFCAGELFYKGGDFWTKGLIELIT